MSIVIAGLWERGYISPLNEADIWKFPLRDFEVNHWTMAPVSGIDVADVEEFPTMSESIAAYRDDHEIVFIDEDAETELSDFDHPENAVYVFGRVGSSPVVELFREGDHRVKIATPAGAGLLWPHQAATVVLYHRSTQWP